MKSALLYGGLALAVAALVAHALLEGDAPPQDSATAVAAAPFDAKPEPAPVRRRSDGMPLAGRMPNESLPTWRMAHAFARSEDLRAFALDAATRPAEGGLAYAREARRQCKAIRRSLRMSAPPMGRYGAREADQGDAQRERAAASLSQRCTAFTKQELLPDEGEDDERLAAAGDVVARLMLQAQRATASGDEGEIRLALRNVLEMRDPLALDEALWPLMLKRTAGGAARVVIDSRAWSGDELAIASDAASLLSCDLGRDCGERDLEVASRCVERAGCFTSLRELRLASHAGSQAAFDAVWTALRDIVETADESRLR